MEDTGVDGRIILKWIFKKWHGGHGLDWFTSEQGQVASCCEHGNEPSDSKKKNARQFLLAEEQFASHEGPCSVDLAS